MAAEDSSVAAPAPTAPSLKVDIDINDSYNPPQNEISFSGLWMAGMYVLAVISFFCTVTWMIELMIQGCKNMLPNLHLFSASQDENENTGDNEGPENGEADYELPTWVSVSSVLALFSLMEEVGVLMAPVASKLL